ncbi:Spy/CpxP family protein refolding chaperone [Microvirga alba]|uniref:Spy/CpxP family protein refolding chaperone n=1 Tax=Microvirga alba TaxID=2791025 RepID=A0A931BLG3_9HYPH|nr:Spy/CpxP family protein refolding chaperone [Microvirga alba]MBF9233431.1 Spy/CpxP family protein refolding chaperone [Microvirga alba]
MKTFAIFSTASALALAATIAYAQPAPPSAGSPAPRGQMTRADFDSLTDARVASIQAGLKLTPDQQKLWPPVEKAIRAMATTRAERREALRERASRTERPDMMQRLERGAAFSSKNAENLNALSTAMKPLWASLDDRQKKLLPVLMREGREGRMAEWRHRGAEMMHRGGPQGQQAPAPKQ